jgi:hypothetical protein
MSDRSGSGDALRDRQERAIACLSMSPTILRAAELADVGFSTLRRWLKEPGFAARYREARTQMVDAAVNQLRRTLDKTAEALERNLTCGVPAVEVSATKAAFELVFRGTEVLDQEGRITELEQLLKGGDGHAGGAGEAGGASDGTGLGEETMP